MNILFSRIIIVFICSMPLFALGQDPVVEPSGNHHNREAIELTKIEREFVLSEMRVFLETTQKIVVGITDDNMQLVAESARESGRAAQVNMPKSLGGKLPVTFKELGSDTHRKFDELALDAEQLGDKDHALSQLGVLLNNCVSCHSSFRIVVE